MRDALQNPWLVIPVALVAFLGLARVARLRPAMRPMLAPFALTALVWCGLVVLASAGATMAPATLLVLLLVPLLMLVVRGAVLAFDVLFRRSHGEAQPAVLESVVAVLLYAVGGTRRSVVALDARTGELKWVYSVDEGRRADVAPRKLSGRGLSYWTDGKGDERIVFVTIGYRLVELNAKTGHPVPTFGKEGVIDLK